jgi:hypothetical protein
MTSPALWDKAAAEKMGRKKLKRENAEAAAPDDPPAGRHATPALGQQRTSGSGHQAVDNRLAFLHDCIS